MFEYRILDKNGRDYHDHMSNMPILTDIGIARAACVYLSWRWNYAAPYTIEQRLRTPDNEWSPIITVDETRRNITRQLSGVDPVTAERLGY